jgi:hypothetical protein
MGAGGKRMVSEHRDELYSRNNFECSITQVDNN